MLVSGHLWCLCTCTTPEAAPTGLLGPCFPQTPWGVGSGEREGWWARQSCPNLVLVWSPAAMGTMSAGFLAAANPAEIHWPGFVQQRSWITAEWLCLCFQRPLRWKWGVKVHNSPGLRHFVPTFGLALPANTGWSIPKIGVLSHHRETHPVLSWAESRPLHLSLGHADFHLLFLL